MYYYEEDRYKKADRTVALITTVVCLAVGLLLSFLIKIKILDSFAPYPPPEDYIVMDFGDTGLIAPNLPARQTRYVEEDQVDDIFDPEGDRNTSAQTGIVRNNKTVDTVTARPRTVNQMALYSNTSSVSSTNSQTDATNFAQGGISTGTVGSTGNSPTGRFSLEGRYVQGNIVKPVYAGNREGRIVIDIFVNRDGTVETANYNTLKSTLSDQKMIDESRKAALATRFSRDAGATMTQKGTITYYYELK